MDISNFDLHLGAETASYAVETSLTESLSGSGGGAGGGGYQTHPNKRILGNPS